MRRLIDLIDIDSVAEAIRGELAELFPGTRFQVEAKRGPFSGYISVKWTDGPALTRVQETGIRERYDLIIVDEPTGERIKAGSLFVRPEREHHEKASEKDRPIEGEVDGLSEIIMTLSDEFKDYTMLRDMILADVRTGNKARTGCLFVRYEREYSAEALETVRCTSPYLSYDYAFLAETDFPEMPQVRGLIVRREHLELIRRGAKTQTRRLHKRPLKAGDLVILKHDWGREWQPITVIRVNESYTQRLGDVTEQDARCEGFGSLREFKAMWPRYSGVAWDPDLVVQVYEFKLFS